ncbi:YfhO family protein [Turicibacter sanguinis]|uniref:YfhO family protein n=1 Tax=Turicibacter sanguinis TaxID=154288 RepID=UPI001053A694|nr:YfhO family protein [Turicibacter sanguinis]MCU7212708.1 YfhO family protein [Turicibacter sanguinis]QJS17825.1 YfhO family protein [Turicibacter sanguinis]
MLKRYLKEEKFTLLSFLILTLLIFSPYILHLKSFTLGFDYQNQHLYFYEEFHRLLSSGEAPFWSWNLFLGTNFIGSKTYYLLGDPFAYLTLLFPASKMMGAVFYITLLKLFVALIGVSAFLKEMGIKSQMRFIPSIMYTFCGWGSLFVEHPMYLTWFALLPLIFLAIEKYLNKGRVSLVVFASFILLISNYYLFWSLCVFLVFYWPLRYFMTHEFNIRAFILSSLKLVAAFILGACMTLILILPAVIHTALNTRLNEASEGLSFLWRPIKIYLDIIMRSFCPNFDSTWDKALLFNTDDYRTNQLTLYSGVVTYLFVFSYFLDKTKYKLKENWLWLSLYGILGLLLMTPYGGSLMHGLSEPTFRFTILIIMVNVIIVAKYLNHREFKRLPLVLSSVIIIALLIGLIVIGSNSYEYLQELQLKELFVMKVTIVLVIAYLLILLFIKKFSIKIASIAILLILELGISASMTLNRYPDGSEDFRLGEKYDQEAFDYLEELDSSLYRTYTPIRATDYSIYRNLNLHYGYKSVSTYDSMYQFTLSDFFSLIGANPTYWGFHILESETAKMLGVKYYVISHDEQDLIDNLDELTLLKTFEHESVYLYNDYLPIGFTYSNYLKQSDALAMSPSEIDFVNTLVLEDDDFESLSLKKQSDKRDLFEQTTYSQNRIDGTITITSPAYLYFSIPYDKGWNLSVNGVKTNFDKVQGGFIGLPLETGHYNITLTYTPPGFKLGAILTTISTLGFITILIIEFKKNELGN